MAANAVPSLHALWIGWRLLPIVGPRDRETRARSNTMGERRQLPDDVHVLPRRAASHDAACRAARIEVAQRPGQLRLAGVAADKGPWIAGSVLCYASGSRRFLGKDTTKPSGIPA